MKVSALSSNRHPGKSKYALVGDEVGSMESDFTLAAGCRERIR